MNNLIVKEVELNNITMVACKSNKGQILVSIKSICEGLGINYSSQLKRISREEVLSEGVVKMTIPTNGGNQEINTMNIDYLPYFLIGIKSKLCREEVQPKLKDFKLRAKDVLANAFIKQQHTDDYYIQREAGKIVRNMLTDTIKDKIPDSPHKKFAYPNYTRLIYKILFNKTTVQLREERKVPKSKSLRDFFNPDELKEIQQLENIITGLISLGMGYEEIKNMLNQRYLKRIA